MPVSNDVVWFRYSDSLVHSGGFDDRGDPLPGSEVRIYLSTYRVIRETPKGVWLQDFKPRFVLRGARKRFACPTQEEALASFIARKERQADIHQACINRATDAIKIAQGMLRKGLLKGGVSLKEFPSWVEKLATSQAPSP